MELQGKKVNFLGDSITHGTGASCNENCYVSVFGRISGAEVRNYGIGGTRIARQKTPTEPVWDNGDFVMRADGMDSDADVVVVFGGTNDYGHGDAPLGSFESHDVYTFYGALRTLCEKLIAKYPKAKIVFMTPTHRCAENKLINERGIRNVATLSQYADIIKEVTKYYAIPVLDLYAVSGMQPEVEVLKQTYMPDGLHPNDAGHEKIAKLLYSFLTVLH